MQTRKNRVVATTALLLILLAATNAAVTGNNEKKTLSQLIKEDRSLNATCVKVWKNISDFLNSGILEKGPPTLNLTAKYIDGRRIWLSHIQQISSNSGILADGSKLEKRNRDVQNVENIHSALDTILHTLLHYSEIEIMAEKFFNVSTEFNDTYEYDIGEESLEATKQFLAMLKKVMISVNGVDTSLMYHNKNDPLYCVWIKNFPHIQDCDNYINITKKSLQEQIYIMNRLKAELIFRDYIDPIVYILILSTGLVFNVMLLTMFARKKEIRTAPNIMIFNIVMCDVLNLIFNLPLQYFGYYYPQYIRLSVPVCVLFVTLRCMFTSTSALSVVALSAQRFFATLPTFHNLRARSHLSPLSITIFYILFIWAAASSIVLPDTLGDKVCDDKPIGKSGRKSAKIVSLHEFLVYCFALPTLMLIFTVMTARRLRQSAKEIPGVVRHKVYEDARNRGATVVTALCIMFTISYVPFFLWGRVATMLNLDRFETKYKTLDNITYYLLFSNPCFNPLALYVTSNTFRKLFNGYLFGCCKKRRTLVRTDTQMSIDVTRSTPPQQESDI